MFRSDILIPLSTVSEVNGIFSNKEFNLWESTKGNDNSLYCFDFSDQQLAEIFFLPFKK